MRLVSSFGTRRGAVRVTVELERLRQAAPEVPAHEVVRPSAPRSGVSELYTRGRLALKASVRRNSRSGLLASHRALPLRSAIEAPVSRTLTPLGAHSPRR